MRTLVSLRWLRQDAGAPRPAPPVPMFAIQTARCPDCRQHPLWALLPRLWGSPAWARQGKALGLLIALVVAAAAMSGCEKARQDRGQLEALRQGAAAIEQYSAATDRANASHRDVLAAFAAANASSNLTDYKAALRTKVLPAMDAFIEKLAAMPTRTPELKKIHGGLTEAYRRCRDAVAEFERELKDPAGLPRFDTIRGELQQAVRQYSDELGKYYAAHRRQLRLEAGKEAGNQAGKEAGKAVDKEAALGADATASAASGQRMAAAVGPAAGATATDRP